MKIFWAGSEDSFHLVLKAEEKLDKLLASEDGMKAGFIDDMLAKLPPIWQHEGSTAIVEVNGPLIQGEAGWLRIFGVLGYDDVLKAALEAALDPKTEKMLYHINSPGGDVSGIIETVGALRQISAMRPSAVHTSELMASAGYWLASGIKGQITAGPTAVVGSIGVLQIHRENSKMMDNAGVKVTVLRSGKFKAEMNSAEPLSDTARAHAEEQLADVHKLFRADVAKARPNMTSEELAEATEGQTFLGKRAVAAGLVDKIGSFQLAQNLLDKQKHPRDTSPNSKGKAMILTPEQLAQLAAGTPIQAFGYNPDGTDMSAAEIEAFNKKATDEAAAAQKVIDDKKAADEAAALAAKEPKEEDKGVVALLKEQLAASQAEVSKLTVAATAHTSMAAVHEGLLAIARGSVSNMLIPLGASSAAVDGMDAAAVVAEHARVKAQFLEKFPTKRVSKETAAPGAKQEIPAAFLARTAAAQTKSK